MKDFSFGQHLSLPHNLSFENDTVSTIQKVAVQMQEKIDDAIVAEIIKTAIEQGITDLYILDKKNIMAALQKQIPMKVAYSDTYSHTCPACGRLMIYDCFGEAGDFCRDCGQALDWSDVE